jgi:hypothetical protein
MSKLSRETMLIFASTAGFEQLEQFGSLANGSPNYLTPVAASIPTIQALSNYLEGWFGGVVGSNLPAIEDMNAIAFLFAYQLAYIFQAGIPEWDAGTTYFTGSLCTGVGNGIIYVSLQDNNTNNALSNISFWDVNGGGANLVNKSATYPLVAGDNGKTFLTNTSGGAVVYTLPAPALNFKVKFKDNGNAQVNNITINPHAAETIDGQSSIVMSFPYGWIELISDGTNWFITDQSKNISAWATYTPTITGFGSCTALNYVWRRNGQSIEVQGYMETGTGTGVAAKVSLPSGLTFATIGLSNVGLQSAFGTYLSGALTQVQQAITALAGDSAFQFTLFNGSGNTVALGTDLASGPSGFGCQITAPIAGWTNY